MSVGIVHVLPHKNQEFHIHYGHEQMLYVLQGTGTSWVNGKEKKFRPGDYLVIESDATHQLVNDSEEEIIELMVSSPIPIGYEVTYRKNEDLLPSHMDYEEGHISMLYAACEQLKSSLLENISTPFSILDAKRKMVMKNNLFPQTCLHHCDPIYRSTSCACLHCRYRDGNPDGAHLSYVCPHGMKLFFIPIVLDGKVVGTVRGGHFYAPPEAEPLDLSLDDPAYQVPQSHEISVLRVLHRIGASIEDCIRMIQSVSLLESQKQILQDATKTNDSLSRNLVAIEEQVTNLKINHHFLFNTLNCIASMALTGDRGDLYTNILNLSKMFRYTMTTDVQKVSLSKELEYLQTYLSLQKLRYKDSLHIDYSIDHTCLDIQVPFNFLQPVVENAFTHGFMSYDYDKYVTIKVEAGGRGVRIRIENNGILLTEEDKARANRSLSSGSGHGLSLIWEKLKACYNQDFTMELVTYGDKTAVVLSLPRYH